MSGAGRDLLQFRKKSLILNSEQPGFKRISLELSEVLNGVSSDGSEPQKLTVVACGLLKAGKSTLLNLLSDHVEAEYFPSGPVRETVELRAFETEDFVFLDTPGLDCDDTDDRTALQGVAESDVLLLVHNLREGELHQQELEWLARIAKVASGARLDERLLVVLTYMEEMEDRYEFIVQRVRQQCANAVGVVPVCFAVSNSRYRKGVLEKKKLLIEKSGVKDVLEYLYDRRDELLKAAFMDRRQRWLDRRDALLVEVREELRKRMEVVESIKAKYFGALDGLVCDIENVADVARKRVENYEKIA